MGLIGALGGMSFDQERERLQKIRSPLMQQYRAIIGQILQDVQHSTQAFRDWLGAYAPVVRRQIDAQLGFAAQQTDLARQVAANAAAFAPEVFAAKAREEVATAYDVAGQNALQKLAQMGVDPTSIRAGALDRAFAARRAADVARAGNAARLQGALGQAELAGRATQLQQAGLGGALQAGGALAQGLAGTASSVLGNPTQQAMGLSNLVMSEAQLRQAANQSRMNAIGGLMGLGGLLGGAALMGVDWANLMGTGLGAAPQVPRAFNPSTGMFGGV